MRSGFKRYTPDGPGIIPAPELFLPDDIIYNTVDRKAYHLDNAGHVVRFDHRINILSEDEAVTVGSGGDFETLTILFDCLTAKIPEYSANGITVVATLLSGYVMSEQVLVRGQQFGFVTIRSQDAVVTIDDSAMTVDFSTTDYELEAYPAFGVSMGGVLPKIDTVFQFGATSLNIGKHGVLSIGAGSTADVLPGAGFINSPQYGFIAMRGGAINATDTVSNGAYDYDIAVKDGGIITANGATGTLSQNNKAITTDGIIF